MLPINKYYTQLLYVSTINPMCAGFFGGHVTCQTGIIVDATYEQGVNNLW